MSLEFEFQQQFNPLNQQLLSSDATFSGSEMYESMIALEPLAKKIGSDSQELLELYNALSLLQKKRGETEDQITYSKAALAIQQIRNTLNIHDHLLLANRLMSALEENEEWEEAVFYSETVCNLSEQDPELSQSQKIHLKQQRGYLLHEVGQYQDAIKINLATLDLAEKEFGENAEELISLLTNIAQNYYALGNFVESEKILTRALIIAREQQDDDQQFEMLFQLGVLAHEAGNPTLAKSRFMEYRELAETLDDEFYLEQADNIMQEFAKRLANLTH